MLIQKDGWFWPETDKECWPWLQKEEGILDDIMNFCDQKRVMVQAGGNCGYYVKKYADVFGHVYTFEPDHLNFMALTMNLMTHANVTKIQALVGKAASPKNLYYYEHNTGMHRVAEVEGFMPVLQIDELRLPVCDMINLDTEGYEGPALEGSVETLKRCRPVVAVEMMGHGEKYNWPDERIIQFLEELDYKMVKKMKHDAIFKCNS